MTVPNSPSLSDGVAECGGPGNLRAYYRGGPYVPNTSANSAISTSPSGLRLSQFAGARAYTPMSLPVSTNNGSCLIQPGYNACTSVGYFTVSPSHGTPPYSYAWHITSMPAGVSYSGHHTKQMMVSYRGYVGQETVKAYCTVTDATGTSKNTATKTVRLNQTSLN